MFKEIELAMYMQNIGNQYGFNTICKVETENSLQNEILLILILNRDRNFHVLHTTLPQQ